MNRKFFIITTIFVLLSFLTGCIGGLANSFFTINVSGTEGVAFSGYYKVTKNTGETIIEEISGTVPFEVDVKGYFVFCKIKKEGGKGTLKLELLKFGNSISSDETTELDKFITVYSR